MKINYRNWSLGYRLFPIGIIFMSLLLFSLGWIQPKSDKGFFNVEMPVFMDGIPLSEYHHEIRPVRSNDYFGGILWECGISPQKHVKVIECSKDIFNFNALREGHQFHQLYDPTDCQLKWLIYEPRPQYAFRFKMDDDPILEKIHRPVQYIEKKAAGFIKSSLWNAMNDANLPINLIVGLETALECAVDFHHLQQGDRFKVIYSEEVIDDRSVGLGPIEAASFTQGDSTYYAFYYEKDSLKGFYDLQGRPMKSMFLKAPIRFSRISSHFSPSRLHPILKIRRPHLGTDYAAPYGTEIMAVADGVVTAATRSGGNGIYVKIRHNGTYQTQYLHMQKIARGIKPGTRVRQGQVIGYVGSTGLATGPHVCFRFWKNGKQVSHLRERLPEAKPMPTEMLPEYLVHCNKLMAKLRSVVPVHEEITSGPSKPSITNP